MVRWHIFLCIFRKGRSQERVKDLVEQNVIGKDPEVADWEFHRGERMGHQTGLRKENCWERKKGAIKNLFEHV
jgi:hypothetical protein